MPNSPARLIRNGLARSLGLQGRDVFKGAFDNLNASAELPDRSEAAEVSRVQD